MSPQLAFMSIAVGDVLPRKSLTITQEMIDAYAELSGDFNPIHVDLEAAAASEFKGTIAHGTIPLEPVMQSICAWLGRPAFPGGTAMNLRYRAPSRPGDTISSDATVSETLERDGRRLARVDFSCVNQRGEAVISGTWEVVVP